MKKVIIGLLLICVVAGLVAVGTWAAFRDVETSTDNLFTAGSMDLKVDGEDDPISAYFDTIECVKPGDSGEVTIELTNVGCVDGMLDLMITITESDENIAVEPELNVGDLEDDLGDLFDGELAANLEMRITADLDGDTVFETLVAEGALSVIEAINYVYGALDAGASMDLKIEWWVDSTVGNMIMTDTLRFDIEFSLDQKMEACLTLIDIDQPDQAQECETVDISVNVKNSGGEAGECTMDVVVTYPDGTVMAEALGVPTGMIDSLATESVLVFDDLHIPVTDPALPTPYTLTVTATPGAECCDQTPITCEIEVTDPPCLHVVAIEQPEYAWPCMEIMIGVTIHNQGGKPGECEVWLDLMNLDTGMPPATVDPALLTPQPTGVVDLCEENQVTIYFGPFHVDETWFPGVLVLAGSCCDIEPFECVIIAGPPPPQPSSEWIYDVHYDAAEPGDPTYSDDTVWQQHLVGTVETIPDLLPDCVPLPPPGPGEGPAVHVQIDPLYGGVQPLRYVTSGGTTLDMQPGMVDAYANVLDGTTMYMYTDAMVMGGVLYMNLEVGYDTYVLTSGAGTNIGQPYTAGSSWTYDSHTIANIAAMGGCQPEAVATVTVTVAGPMPDPTGTYPNCMEITTDDPLVPGTKVDYYDSTVQGIVYTLDTETYDGTETQTLTSYNIVLP